MQFAYTVGKIIIWSPADFCPFKKKKKGFIIFMVGLFELRQNIKQQIQKKAAYKC